MHRLREPPQYLRSAGEKQVEVVVDVEVVVPCQPSGSGFCLLVSGRRIGRGKASWIEAGHGYRVYGDNAGRKRPPNFKQNAPRRYIPDSGNPATGGGGFS